MRKISHHFIIGLRTRSRAYTMIELLTVTAIIILLAGLLIPVVNRARAKARATFCVNNLRQWGSAFLLYASDENGFLPAEGTVSNATTIAATGAWYNAVPPYLNQKRYTDIPAPRVNFTGDLHVWTCPQKFRVRPVSTTTNNSIFFAMNDLLNNVQGDGNTTQHVRLARLTAPAQTVLMFDIFAHETFGSPITTSGSRTPYSNLHSGGANFLFVDGHVEWFPTVAYWAGSPVTNYPGLGWWP